MKPITNYFFKRNGFTLIETVIAIGIFMIVATAIYFSYSNILDIFSASYLNLTALSVLDGEFELIRNMPYPDVGVVGGIPSGIIPAEKNVVYGSITFLAKTTVRNVDDPFDGVQGGTPNDTSPADYKLVEIEVTCPSCPRFIPAKATTTVGPAGLESVTDNGSLLIKVFNASGIPVSGALVSVVNNSVSPAVNTSDVTNAQGVLNLIDVPPGTNYAVTVSKAGYSTDRTYTSGGGTNPNPLKPNATVLAQKITETSFVIDRVSTLNMRTQNEFCAGTGNIDFLQTGQKLIGTNPNVLKYSANHTTNSFGTLSIGGLEFDAYNFQNTDSAYEVSGFSPVTPLAVDPAGTYSMTWTMAPKVPSAILVTVKDKNGQLVNDADVSLTRTGFSAQEFTGRRYLIHTDWTGQYDSKSPDMYNPAGELRIASVGGKYASSSDEWLVSSTVDFGTSDISFYNMNLSFSQPPLTTVRIQIASNNDNSTWNFIGPDGTAGSYYTSSGTQLNSIHNNKRYLRYKVILRTDDENVTPSFQDMTIYFHSSCVGDGQAYFSGLNQGTYRITVQKSGFKNYTDTGLKIDSSWKDYRVILSPQ